MSLSSGCSTVSPRTGTAQRPPPTCPERSCGALKLPSSPAAAVAGACSSGSAARRLCRPAANPWKEDAAVTVSHRSPGTAVPASWHEPMSSAASGRSSVPPRWVCAALMVPVPLCGRDRPRFVSATGPCGLGGAGLGWQRCRRPQSWVSWVRVGVCSVCRRLAHPVPGAGVAVLAVPPRARARALGSSCSPERSLFKPGVQKEFSACVVKSL